MEHKKLRKYMMQFSTNQLKSYLDENLLSALLEWNSDDGLFTKAKLSEMILTINGVSILKNKEFRQEIMKRFSRDQILNLKTYLPKKYSDFEDMNELVKIIANQQWKKSDLTEKFLEYIEINPSEVFKGNETDVESITMLKSHEKFYELLDYQYIIRQKVLTRLKSGEDLSRMLVHMPTGTGKTKTAMHIICNHYNYTLKKQGLILWVAHTKELLDQAYDTFRNVWSNIGNGEITTYRLYDKFEFNVDNKQLNGFMVCGIQKLMSIQQSNKELYDKIKRDIKLIVYDEAHKAAASKTKDIIEDLMTRKNGLKDRALLGLTATPGRSNEPSVDNKTLTAMFGGCLITIDTNLMNEVNYTHNEARNMKAPNDIIKYFQDRGVLAKIEKEELTYDNDISLDDLNKIKIVSNSNGYEDFSTESLKLIAKSKNRNLMIMQKLTELDNENVPTIVFACSVQHAQILSSMLTLQGTKNVCVFGSMSSTERNEAIRRFKNREDDCNIIINYEVLTTGFDSTNIKCVFITRPTQSIVLYSQMLGRGLRGPQMGGNEKCLLIDIKDNLQKFNENMAFSHFNNYWGGK